MNHSPSFNIHISGILLPERNYKAAKNEYNEGNYDFCVNRLYYAVFYAVSAVLIIRGQNYKKHTAVRAAVHRDFVKPGTISVEFGKLYDSLLRDREEADYVAFVEFDSEVIEEELNMARKFIDKFKDIFKEEIDNEDSND